MLWTAPIIARHEIIVWLALLNRLSTKDRLIAWGIRVDDLCVLCSEKMETRDQLFFEFNYSKQIWKTILALCGLDRDVMCWNNELRWAINRRGIRKIFGNNAQSPDFIVEKIKNLVCYRRGINWRVPTRCKDERVSLASNATNLPSFRESIDSQKQKFAAFGLNTQDLVALVGGHTVGTSACQFFSYRLYNFTNGGPDPTINPAFVPQLQALCPQNGDSSRRIDLDTGSGNRFDTSFFDNLRNGRGILESDQKLWTDASTRTFVQHFLGQRGLRPLNFNVEFARSMVKMSNIGVKTSANGKIRRICSAVN
ncbi:hypothetical protein DITRI_Ditri08aG0086500 [Diplodiscus trichospermus]